MLLFSIVTFAYATILEWFLLRGAVPGISLRNEKLLPVSALLGPYTGVRAGAAASLIFEVSDLLNALMALPNLLGLLLLADVIRDETRIYFSGK